MKPKVAILLIAMIVVASVLAGNMAFASSVSASVYLTITVVGTLSLNVDENSLATSPDEISVEAFSEMKKHDIVVTKVARDNSTVWLLTKTE